MPAGPAGTNRDLLRGSDGLRPSSPEGRLCGAAPPPALRAGVLPRIASERLRYAKSQGRRFFLSCEARLAEGDAGGGSLRSNEGARSSPTRPSLRGRRAKPVGTPEKSRFVPDGFSRINVHEP